MCRGQQFIATQQCGNSQLQLIGIKAHTQRYTGSIVINWRIEIMAHGCDGLVFSGLAEDVVFVS